MAYTKLKTTKDGRKYYECQFSRGRGNGYITRRFYPEQTWSQKYTERELAKFISDIQHQIEAGTLISRNEEKEREAAAQAELAKLKTVRGYVADVFMPAKTAVFSENSRASYQMFVDKHILPYIGDLLMIDVTPALLTKRLLDYQIDGNGHSHASCVKLYNILNGIFQMAFFDDTITVNPMLKVKRPAQKKDDKKESESDKALTVDELNYVLQCLEKEPLKWRAYIQLAVDTGARRGELCGLKWADIDMKECTIVIKRNVGYTKEKGIFINNPKNGKTRKIDIGEDTVRLLQLVRKEQVKSYISEYVFTQESSNQYKYADNVDHKKQDVKIITKVDTPMHPDSPTRYFSKFGKRYNIDNFHPHLLRHTSASVAITHGADVVSVSERLGHSDTAVTLRMYAHANEESIRRAGQTVRDALKKASQN